MAYDLKLCYLTNTDTHTESTYKNTVIWYVFLSLFFSVMWMLPNYFEYLKSYKKCIDC